jgi:hypothetical protein
MTYEEAKQSLLNTHIQLGRSYGKTVFNDSLSMAIKAINKQIPQKPSIYGEDEIKVCSCKECNYTVLWKQKYCYNCGQALDWSE